MDTTLEKLKKLKINLKIRLIIFFLLIFILMIFFWIFVSCFCSIFINTQIILIEDTLLSFVLSMIYPFGLNLIPPIFRIYALRNKDKKCVYSIGKIITLI